jgi:hypothetical protein
MLRGVIEIVDSDGCAFTYMDDVVVLVCATGLFLVPTHVCALRVAALWVVLHHAMAQCLPLPPLPQFSPLP